jgi:hypothetical protein
LKFCCCTILSSLFRTFVAVFRVHSRLLETSPNQLGQKIEENKHQLEKDEKPEIQPLGVLWNLVGTGLRWLRVVLLLPQWAWLHLTVSELRPQLLHFSGLAFILSHC